jgi:hypothetical protein
MMKVDKDKVESIVSEDLKKKYPDTERIEFVYLKFYEKPEGWFILGWLSTKKEGTRVFTYTIDATTGQIKEYWIIPR